MCSRRRGIACLLKLLLSAAMYAFVAVFLLSVYSSHTVTLTPYRRTEQPFHCTFPVCNDSFTYNDVIIEVDTMATAPVPALDVLDTQPNLDPQLNHTAYNESVGYLNYDVWTQMPGFVVDDMRIRRSFPNHPDIRQMTNTLKIDFSEAAGDTHDAGRYAHKIYGYLLPVLTGLHSFGFNISNRTALFGLELWLSNSSDPLNMTKILTADVTNQGVASSQPTKRRRKWRKQKDTPPPATQPPPLPNQFVTSEAVWLSAGVLYYMEFLQKAFDGSIVVELTWRFPKSSNYVSIRNDSFMPAVELSDTDEFVMSPVATILQGPLPSNKLQSHRRVSFVGDTVYPATDLDVLPPCNFSSLYAFPRSLQEYDAHNEVFVSGTYPGDETIIWITLHNKMPPFVIKNEVVENVINLYKKALNTSTKYRGNVEKVHYMEETENKHHGARFLVELDILLDGQSNMVHTAEYVYLPHRSSDLCHTSNFQWKHYANVYLVVTLKSLGPWTRHLIHNMEHNQKVTQDFSLELVIVDYESSDLNVEEELAKSSLPKWHYIRKSGPFSRAGGLQAGLDYVTDPNSIVLTMDMHLAIPPGFVNYARKHVIQGKMAFAPMFFRLDKGCTEVNIQGYWEPYTFGIFGMYKSDWETIGGFNTTHYTYHWGGEDVDVADRALEHGYEIFRIRYPGFHHYFHSRKGLWNSQQ